jgi:alpha-tubulin suppressor-like RCC1 family protein
VADARRVLVLVTTIAIGFSMGQANTTTGRIGRALLGVTLLAGVLAGTLARPASAAVSTPTPLLQDPPDTRTPLSSGPAVTFAVDRARGHLFAATGFPISTVMVTDMSGVLLKTITGETGALGMTISPDGTSLYVALREGDAISEIDLVSLTERRRIPTGTASCPSWLATAGSRVWVSYGCSEKAAIVSLDLAAPSVTLPPPPDDRYYTPPRISSASSTSTLLVAAIGSAFNSTIDLYDASASALARTRTYFSDHVYYASAVVVTPDEKTAFVVAIDGSGQLGSYGAIAFGLPDLSRGPTYRTGPHTAGIAVSPDGSHLAMTSSGMYGSDFWVFPVGALTPTHTRNYPDLEAPGAPVAFNLDGSKAFIFRRNTDNSPSLTLVNGLQVDPARLSVRPTPSGGIAPGTTATVSGAVRTTDGTPNRGLAVAVTRSGPDGRRVLPPATTDAAGVFTVADVPPGPGGFTYHFTWAGDPAHPPASAFGSLRVLGSAAPSVLPSPPAAGSFDNDLKLVKFGAMVVDELHRRVFVSDQGAGVVAVTDLDGNRLTTVAGLPGALGMALSRDSTTLFVALPTANAVAAVDAADLVEVGRWRVGALAELPNAVAEAGNQIFFGYHDIEDSGGGWGSFSLAAPDDVALWDHVEGPTQPTLFATSRSDPNLLIAGNYDGQTGRYDASTNPPREVAFSATLATGTDPRLSDDGTTLMLAGTSPVDPMTLTPQVNPHYTTELDIRSAVAITADATFVAVGAELDSTTSRIRLWPRGGGEPLRVISVKGDVVWQGMAFTSDASRLYVVTGDSRFSGDHPVMHVLNRTTAPKAVTAYGWNGLGELGMGATTDTRVASSVPGGAISIAAGGYHNLAVARDGTVWAWGWNGFGQLGNGGTTATVGPVKVEGLSDVVAVGAGLADSFAVKRDGTLWGWGWNGFGQLGDGTTTDRSRPVQVSGLTQVTSVAAGGYHTLALGRDGTVWSWGWNGLGLLGDGTTTDRLRPQVVPGLVNVRSIAAGWLHSLASDTDENVWTWGWNAYGQLGDGTTTDRTSPTRLAVGAHVDAVAGGAYHSMLLTSEGLIWTWGWNGAGQLGDGTLTDHNRPVQVPGFYGGATSISAGMGHSLAVINGVAVGWGWNPFGQLGDGTWTDRRLPAVIAGLGTATSVAAGGLHSMAM